MPEGTHVQIYDESTDRAIVANLDKLAKSVGAARARNEPVLMFCGHGVRRSPLAGAWYLHRAEKLSLDAAYQPDLGSAPEGGTRLGVDRRYEGTSRVGRTLAGTDPMRAEDDVDVPWVAGLTASELGAADRFVQEAGRERRLFNHLSAEHAKEGRASYIEIDAPLELYAIVRLVRPRHVVEVGVSSGVSSAYLLQALERNEHGTLHSIDRPKRTPSRAGTRPASKNPSWSLPTGRESGWAVPESLRRTVGPSNRRQGRHHPALYRGIGPSGPVRLRRPARRPTFPAGVLPARSPIDPKRDRDRRSWTGRRSMPGPSSLGPLAECHALREGRTGALRVPEPGKAGSLEDGVREGASSNLTFHTLTGGGAAIEVAPTPPRKVATAAHERRGEGGATRLGSPPRGRLNRLGVLPLRADWRGGPAGCLRCRTRPRAPPGT